MEDPEIVTKNLDHDDNPFSVDCIDQQRLYLGNATAARNIDFLKSHQISHIITIDSFPIPAYVCSSASVINKYIHIADMSKENILEHFTDCISFIEDALKDPEATNGVLVHCFYGVSRQVFMTSISPDQVLIETELYCFRSATIVIAYLMKKYALNYQKAFEKAKSKRVLVQPNNGFVHQLKLFYKMGYKIDPSCKNYKLFRLKLASEQVKSARILPSSFLNLLKPDPGLIQECPDPHVYRCRKCRRIVAARSNLITHKPKDQENLYDSPKHLKQIKLQSAQKFLSEVCQEEAGNSNDLETIEMTDKLLGTTLSEKSLSKEICEPEICTQTFFVEPLSWMKDVASNVQGKLYCPSCKTKLGSFNWIMASKCPCGQQVSPSFYLVPSKIEYSNIVQNIIQVTV